MHADAIALINDIEQRFETGMLTYGGVSYWPLVRLRVWSALMQRLVIGQRKDGEAVANTGPSWHDVGRVDAEFARQDLGLLRPAGSAAAAPKNTRALFFLRPEEYMDRTPRGAFAKTADSVFENTPDALKLELCDVRTMGFARLHPPLFLDLPSASDGVRLEPPSELEQGEALCREVEARTGVTLDPATLTADMGKIFYFARIFEKVLRSLSPHALILSVYYHPVGMAWMLACRWAGVRSVDLQHGRLGPHHGLYTDLINAPADGYALMPDLVWCWGARTKRDIETRKAVACTRHGGIVGGNAWLHKWRYGDTAAFSPEGLAAFDSRPGPRILVSLQPLDRPISPELLAAMQKGPRDWLWLLRLHPLRRHTAPEIAALLTKAGVANAEIETATRFPLFTLLQRADHHVTAFSSVTVEAAAFDVRTSLTAAEGQAAFGPEIAAGTARYTPTTEALLAHIHEVLAGPRQPVRSDFVDMEKGLPHRALEAILKP